MKKLLEVLGNFLLALCLATIVFTIALVVVGGVDYAAHHRKPAPCLCPAGYFEDGKSGKQIRCIRLTPAVGQPSTIYYDCK